MGSTTAPTTSTRTVHVSRNTEGQLQLRGRCLNQLSPSYSRPGSTFTSSCALVSTFSRCRSGSCAGAPRWFGESGRDGGDLQDPNVSQAGIYYPRILVSPHPKETCWMSLDDFTQASPVSITFWHCLNMFKHVRCSPDVAPHLTSGGYEDTVDVISPINILFRRGGEF